MNKREQLYTIPDLVLAKRLPMMGDAQVKEYTALLDSFVETFPAEETELKAVMEVNDVPSVIRRLTGIRETLINIHADKIADECWERLNGFDRERPDKIRAYVTFLLSTLASLSIDIQMAFLADEGKLPLQAELSAGAGGAVKSILAVDDDTYFLDTFKVALKDVPCKIIGVTSGVSALNILEKIKPDLFALDIEMPGMDGITLAKKIRAAGQTAPIIFITGNATREYVLKCVGAGAADFIVKPINPQGAVSRINKFLGLAP